MRSQKATYIALSVVLVLAPRALYSSPITPAAITGAWELRTSCTNDHGKQGYCIEMKHGSLVFIFSSDGSWNSVANDPNGTKRAGKYEIRKAQLFLKNADGSLYQNWQPDFSGDGQSFVVAFKQLIETFTRVTD